MTGRARGRSRGRGRTEAPPPGAGDAARRPGEAATAAPVGRGRARGPPSDSVVAPQAAVAPPTSEMAKMVVREPPRGEQREERPRGMYSEPVTRPEGLNKEGSTGTRVQIVTNAYKLETRPNYMIYQYNVGFSPEVDFKKVRIGLINDQQQLLGSVRAFDGMTLFLPKKLPDPITKIVATRRRRDNPEGEPVEITITLTNELPAFNPTSLHIYNIVLRKILKILNMKQVRRDFYSPDQAVNIPQHHLELWPGYQTSIQRFETDILLSADVSHKILRNQTVLEVLYEMYNQDQRNFHANAKKKLIGQIVLTRYNNKTYRVDDINWDLRPHHMFSTSRGEISYIDYYAKAYDKQIADMEQPMLISKPQKVFGRRPNPDDTVNLLPELCYITGLSEEMRADFTLMKDLSVYTRIAPKQRSIQLSRFINSINSNAEASQKLQGWGLQFGRDLLNLDGRVLPTEKIFMRDKVFSYDPKSADWSREIRGNALHSTVNLENWLIVHTGRDTNIAIDFKTTIERVCGPMGIRVFNPRMVAVQNDHTETYLRALMNELDRDRPQIVIVIVPSNRKDRYDAIKKLCCLEKPVPSQVIVSRTLSKKQMLMSVCTKIGIQLNCKLGGEAWALEIPLKGLMVIGVDTYHDSAEKGRSVGGFVASLNQTLTRYYSRCTFQHSGQELIDGLKVCMTAALRKYQEINGMLPDKIIMYRDGVGDGQLQLVIEHEVSQLIQCFKTIQAGAEYKPMFAVVVVKKRINTRLFLKDPRDTNMTNLNNPPPGTVVDTAVTKPEWFDFFLVSQCVRQGTVTPVHFNVIYNSTGLKPDHFQRLSYKLTHLYYNWPGTIKVPAPCQYAHKLAFIVGQSLHKEPHLSLVDKLFFL